MKRFVAVAVGVLSAAACSDSSPLSPPTNSAPAQPTSQIASGDVIVSNSNDAGPGSFRDAVGQANGNASIGSIAFLPQVTRLALRSTVTYTGSQNLTIHGNNATIDGSGTGGTAFRANTTGADVTLTSLTFRDAPAEGIHIEVLPGATGTVQVKLVDVTVQDNAGHGVLVNDQADPTTEEEVQPDSGGSAASLVVEVVGSRFIGNGFSLSDRDGLRVNEGGPGDLTLRTERTRAERNAADGIEIDERGPGNVHIDVSSTTFTRNGEFDREDLDDGFDIDEYNSGSIVGSVVGSSANHNFEEGFDFNENNAGDLQVNFADVEASNNGEEGIDLEEDDDFGAASDPNGGGGNLVTVMNGINTFANGRGADGALKIREKEAGNLDVTLTNIIAHQNLSTGIFVRESSDGNSVVRIDHAVSTGNHDATLSTDDPITLGHGIEILESGGGNLTATVTSCTASANAGNAVFGDETGAGTGSVVVTNLNGAGNLLGSLGGIATLVP